MALCAPSSPADHPLTRLLLLGVSARSVAAALRDPLFAEEPDQAKLIAALKDLGCEEGLVMATCERIEFLVVARPGQRVAGQLLQIIAAAAGCAPAELAGQSYCHLGEDALRHLMAVAASLESQVLGEPQILGQVKQSYRLAQEADLAGPYLSAAAQCAFAAAKRVRRDTPIGQQASSMTHVAQRLVMHPSARRAEAVARRLGCNFAPWEELDLHLADADIVVSDAGSGRFTLLKPQLAAALKRRRQPLLLIDAAVPPDIEPGCADLEDAFVYDLDDLERLASRQSGGRASASALAWGILEEELAGFLRAQAERPATPAVVALRRHFDAVRREVLAAGPDDAEAATRLLVNKLLHDPSEALRRSVAEDPEQAAALEDMLRRLFGLSEVAPGESPDDNAGTLETRAERERKEP